MFFLIIKPFAKIPSADTKSAWCNGEKYRFEDGLCSCYEV
jgi:hypothetical protein